MTRAMVCSVSERVLYGRVYLYSGVMSFDKKEVLKILNI